MATFTMTLREALDLSPDVGLGVYPIFDESYRHTLNEKIVNHFWNREIGQETVDMFRFALRRKMNEIMPFYNQFYKSQLISIDPLLTFSTTAHSVTDGSSLNESTTDSSGGNTSVSAAKSRAVSSETPQTRLAGDGDYATAAQDSVSESTATGTATEVVKGRQAGTQGGTADTQSHGFSQAQSTLLLQYRETFINVDMMVITELEGLFMLVWDNGDSFTPISSFYPFGGKL